MGPRKLAMKRIENATSRHLTFCTRRLALLKGAHELSALCDAQVALIGFSSSGSSLFEYAGPRSMQEIIQTYFDTHQRGGESTQANTSSLPLQNSQTMQRLKEDVQRLEQEERNGPDMKELKLLSAITELEKLESELSHELDGVRQRKDLLIAEQRKEYMIKEQKLRSENEILRKELRKWARCGGQEEAGSDEETMSTADSRWRTIPS